MSQIENTVRGILTYFQERSIPYGVMRNYEGLPNIGHDLDVASRHSDMAIIQSCLGKAAHEYSWDLLTKLSYRNSNNVFRHIDVFRLYDLKNLKCLHLDFLHGLTSYGFEILSEKELMEGLLQRDWFYTISLANENLIRCLQLGAIYKGTKTKKIKRYMTKLKQLGPQERTILRELIHTKLSKEGCLALEQLFSENLEDAVKNIYKAKMKNLALALMKKPLASIQDFSLRSGELLHQTFVNNAGLKILAETRNEPSLKQKLIQASKKLSDGAIFNDARVEKTPYNPVSYRQLKFRKEYGLLIQYSTKISAFSHLHYDLILPYALLVKSNSQEIGSTILKHMIGRQTVIYKSPQVLDY